MAKPTKPTVAEQDAARAELLTLLKPGDTVYVIFRHVARSGMMRVLSFAIVAQSESGPYIRRIDWLIHKALNQPYSDKHEGLIFGGCGMDMGFHGVYCLGRRLWPDGTPEPHGKRNGKPDKDGGYALKSHWL